MESPFLFQNDLSKIKKKEKQLSIKLKNADSVRKSKTITWLIKVKQKIKV